MQKLDPRKAMKKLLFIFIAFVICFLPISPADALILDMQVNVKPDESEQLEKSFSDIHEFFSGREGFVKASLDKINDKTYKLQEEWQLLDDYEDSINTKRFRELAAKVPGSSNWSAKEFYSR